MKGSYKGKHFAAGYSQHARRLLLLPFLAVLSLTGLQGCASTNVEYAPGTSVQTLDRLHVKKFGPDERGIETVIADELTKMGFEVSYGPTANSPRPVDAIVTYRDHWMWDLTMYMTRLEIQIRETETNAMIAEGEAYRPSLQRQPPEEVARSVLEKVFAHRR